MGARRAGDLSRKLVAGIGRDEGGWSCGDLWPEEDVISEVVEATDEVGRGPLTCLLIQERLSEFLEKLFADRSCQPMLFGMLL